MQLPAPLQLSKLHVCPESLCGSAVSRAEPARYVLWIF
jgi:hypothetical protein